MPMHLHPNSLAAEKDGDSCHCRQLQLLYTMGKLLHPASIKAPTAMLAMRL